MILLASLCCFWHEVQIGQLCCPIFVSGRIAAEGLTSYRFGSIMAFSDDGKLPRLISQDTAGRFSMTVVHGFRFGLK